MNFNALRYIVAVYEEGNMTKAAKKLFVSQSSLSQCVRAVENELGCTLFERSKSMLRPTPMGEYFVYWANSALTSERRMRERLTEMAQNVQRKLGVGINSLRNNDYLKIALPAFYQRNDVCTVVLKEHNPRQLYSLLTKGTVEFVIDELHPEWAGVRNVPIFREQILVAAPASMPFHVKESDGRYPSIEIFELADKPFIVNGNERFKEAAANLFSRIGSSPNVVLECVNPEFAYNMVKQELGVTFLSELMQRKYPGEDVRYYALADHPIYRTTSVIYPASRRLSEDARLFLAVLKEAGSAFLSEGAQPFDRGDKEGGEEK